MKVWFVRFAAWALPCVALSGLVVAAQSPKQSSASSRNRVEQGAGPLTIHKITSDPLNVLGYGRTNYFLEVQVTSGGDPVAGVSLVAESDNSDTHCNDGYPTLPNGQTQFVCETDPGFNVGAEGIDRIIEISGPSVSVTYTVHLYSEIYPRVLTKVSGDNQSVIGGNDVAQPLVVRVTQGGAPAANERLYVSAFPVGSIHLVFCQPEVSTNGDGLAYISCTSLENYEDYDVVSTVTVGDGPNNLAAPFRVTVKPTNPTVSLRLLSPATLRIRANHTTEDAIRLRAETPSGPAPGVDVYFRWQGSGFYIDPFQSTDSNGMISTSVRLDCVTDSRRVEISLSLGAVDQSVTIEPLAAELEMFDAVQGSGQSGAAGDLVSQPLVVRAVDECGNPAEGVKVDWDVQPRNAATLESTSRVIDSVGQASTRVRIGSGSGPFTVKATAEDRVVEFGLEAEITPTELIAESGASQTVPAGELASELLVTRITDQDGNGVPGERVNFRVLEGDGVLDPSSQLTNASGRASTTFRAGQTEGLVIVEAMAIGQRVRFEITVSEPERDLLIDSGNGQSVPKGETAPEPLGVRVTDSQGSGIPGVQVEFRMVSGAGNLDPTRVPTDEQGRAATLFTAGSRLGPCAVEAAAAGKVKLFECYVTGRKPVVDESSVVDGAGFDIGLTPGGASSIFGANLMEDIQGVMVPSANIAAALAQDGNSQAAGVWPFEFEGVSVHVNGVPAPLFALASIDGSEQINFQTPFDVGTVTEASVEITNNGATTTIANVPILAAKPRIFEVHLDEKVYAAALHTDYTFVGPQSPTLPGEVILLFLTGLGPTDPPVATNLPGPTPPAATVYQPAILLSGVEQELLGSFYAPQLTSVYQVNLRIGEDVAPGEHEIEVLHEGLKGHPLLLPVGTQ